MPHSSVALHHNDQAHHHRQGLCSSGPDHSAHLLLPRWQEFFSAGPKLGEVCAISRNQHAILGGICRLPEPNDSSADGEFHPDFSAWKDAWYYTDEVNGQDVTCFEVFDEHGMGFHKLLLNEKSDKAFGETLARALESDALPQERVTSRVKANHLDGACCATCQARLASRRERHTSILSDYVMHAISMEAPMRVVLMHPGMVTVRHFIPTTWKQHGNWQAVAGHEMSLFLRTCNLSSIEIDLIRLSDIGLCRLAMLRDDRGNLVASLVCEEEG